MSRRLLRVLLAVVLILALAFAGAWLYVRSIGRTQRTGELTLTGLQGPVTVYRDDDGVSHIVAASMHDAFTS